MNVPSVAMFHKLAAENSYFPWQTYSLFILNLNEVD
jgi:hypothetical protein